LPEVKDFPRINQKNGWPDFDKEKQRVTEFDDDMEQCLGASGKSFSERKIQSSMERHAETTNEMNAEIWSHCSNDRPRSSSCFDELKLEYGSLAPTFRAKTWLGIVDINNNQRRKADEEREKFENAYKNCVTGYLNDIGPSGQSERKEREGNILKPNSEGSDEHYCEEDLDLCFLVLGFGGSHDVSLWMGVNESRNSKADYCWEKHTNFKNAAAKVWGHGMAQTPSSDKEFTPDELEGMANDPEKSGFFCSAGDHTDKVCEYPLGGLE
jgi:hypothetical protein